MQQIITIKKNDKNLEVSFPYNPDYISKIKTIEGYRWNPDEKYWSFPYSDGILEKILKTFQGEEIQLDPALQTSFNPGAKSEISNQAKLIEAAEKELKLRGYSQKTRKAYLHHIDRYFRYFGKTSEELDRDNIRRYLLYLIEKERISRAYHNQAVSALKFFYPPSQKATGLPVDECV